MLTMLAVVSLLAVDDGVDGGVDGGSPNNTVIVQPVQLAEVSIYDKCPAVEFSDGGSTPPAIPVEVLGSFHMQVDNPDGGNAYLMPYPRPQRISCKLAACEERNDELEHWAKPLPAWVIVSTALSWFVSGVFLMYETCSRLPVLCGGK